MKAGMIILMLILQNVFIFGQFAHKENREHSSAFQAQFTRMTGQEAADERLNQYDVKQYIIDIEVSPNNTYIQGKVYIRAVATEGPLDTFVVQLNNELQVDSIHLNHVKKAFKHEHNKVKIPVNSSIDFEEMFIATVFYQGKSEGSGVTTGYNKEYDKHVTWTLSEPFYAKEWFPCKQVLSDKADSARINLTTHRNYTAVSNGILEKKEEIGSEKVKYHWVTRYPINYYLLSFSVSDFQEYNFHVGLKGQDSVWIQNYVYDHPGYLTQWKEDVDRTKELMRLYSEKFGTYPFIEEKYGHSLMERGGGMEHQTITTLNNFDFLLVAHELTHQWFGNYVTCASWQDIWINEGFASYGEYVALEQLDSDTSPAEWMEQAHRHALQLPEGSVYVPFSEALDENRIFSFSLSYQKGAALVHMIRYLIDNDKLFFNALRYFLDEYKNGVATGEDFMNTLHSQTGLDFTDFFSQWYYGKGYPRYDVNWQQQDDSVYIDIRQSTSAEEPGLFTLPLELKLHTIEGEDTVIIYEPESNHDRLSVRYFPLVQSIAIDPDNWILNAPSRASKVDMEEYSGISCLIYPNPAEDILNVELEGLKQELKAIDIQDVTGKRIYTSTHQENRFLLNISHLSPGVYFIEIRYESGRIIKKFIKK